MTDRFLTREMLAVDLGAVLAIEQNAQPSPWARLSFEESLAKQHCCRVVCRTNNDQDIVAYHVVCPVSDELHILNLVVAREWQGQGIAHILMHDVIAIATDFDQITKIFLEVRSNNKAAQNLYRQWQFEQIAVRKNYYRGGPEQGREDALVLVKKLN
ncbi:ribosomal protein S18-alanine N-acetyltransferase [Arenicella sp.]|nr:ribosomal protein S18-alanine N-acetyltransferase [Arenicella sp.]